MKAEIRKIIAMILLVVFCATAAITGIAVSAASHTNAASTATPDKAGNSKPALKDGVWQAVYEDGKLLFSVKDDGCGFDAENAPGPEAGHFGLQGVQERIEAIGGTLEIQSGQGKGTKVSCCIPEPCKSCQSC